MTAGLGLALERVDTLLGAAVEDDDLRSSLWLLRLALRLPRVCGPTETLTTHAGPRPGGIVSPGFSDS